MERDIPWGMIALTMLALVAVVMAEMWIRKEPFLPRAKPRRRHRGFGKMKAPAKRARERSKRGGGWR